MAAAVVRIRLTVAMLVVAVRAAAAAAGTAAASPASLSRNRTAAVVADRIRNPITLTKQEMLITNNLLGIAQNEE